MAKTTVATVFTNAPETTMLTGEYPARSQIIRNTQNLFNVFNFTNLLRRPGLGRPTATAKEGTGAEETIRLLVVTLDDDLYFSLRTAAVHCGWKLWKASSMDQGLWPFRRVTRNSGNLRLESGGRRLAACHGPGSRPEPIIRVFFWHQK
jgi:hypothetical protein